MYIYIWFVQQLIETSSHGFVPLQVGFTTSLASSISALATALHSDDVELRGCGAWALWKLWEVMEDEMPQRAVEVGWDGGITIKKNIGLPSGNLTYPGSPGTQKERPHENP